MTAATVPADVVHRVRDDALHRPDGRRTLRRLAGHAALYATVVVIAEAVSRPLTWLAAWVVLAMLLLGSLAASHEAIHNNLFTSKRANRIAGTAFAGVAGIPWAAYRAYHLAHHADTRGPGDPEPSERVDGPSSWVLAILLGGALFAAQLWSAVARAAFGHSPVWAAHRVHARALRRTAVVAVPVIVAVAVLARVGWPAILRWWGVPLALVWGGFASFVAIPEHNGLSGGGSAFTSTRTTRSNAVLRWLFWNNNLHTAHHLMPTVPWHSLGTLQASIEPRCEHVEGGYLRYHLRLLRGTHA